MIDTDKYKGHTQGPWKWLKNSILLQGRAYATNKNAHFPSFIITGRHLDGGWPIDNEANAQLIADAPRILQALIDERAEVKRLRKENDELHAQRVQFFWIQESRTGRSSRYVGEEE